MSQLQYKPDWQQTKQRYKAWWRREKMGRCLLWIEAPKDNLPDEPHPPAPPTAEAQWTDLEYLTASNDYRLRRTFYAAEAYPIWSPGYPGHVSLPTFYGCRLTLDRSTGWHEPILTGQKLDVSGLKLDRGCRWWRFGDEVLHLARRVCAGRSVPSMFAIFGCGDTLAMLRGNQRMLLDVIDDPAGVRRAELRFMDDWFEVFEHQLGLLREGGGEYATWFPIWGPGRFCAIQCDVSYGISPEAFRECFVPALAKQAGGLDHVIYHLDGVGAFHLVEDVCKIDGVGAVQVLPGAGKPGPLHYMDVLQTVQRMGKGLHITISVEQVPEALSRLSSRGLFIHASGVKSEAHARRTVEQACKLSVDRG